MARGKKKAVAGVREDVILGEMTRRAGFGFGPGGDPEVPELLTYDGDAHLCTVAPTRSGKGVGVIIPNLLTYNGPVIVIDPKGENYQVTARRRREMGHKVIKLDPFNIVDEESDCLNPLDLFKLAGTDVECESQAIAELLARGLRGSKEPFWDINGSAFASGLIALAGSAGDDARCNLADVIDRLTADDIVYSLAVVLDTIGKQICPLAYREISTVLQMPDVTRGGVIATTQTYFKPLLAQRVMRTLRSSSFDLQDIVDGKPMTIYLVLPPNRMKSHLGLIKLWVGTLLIALFSRKYQAEMRTLFLLDEVAQLGSFPLLESMLTLSAGYGVRVHSFWQDLSQIRSCYPDSWKTILNNCAVVQTFGIYNRDMANQWGDFLDHTPQQLRTMDLNEQLLSIHGKGEVRCRRLNYLTDARFARMFDGNRLHQRPPSGESGRVPPATEPLNTHRLDLTKKDEGPQPPGQS